MRAFVITLFSVSMVTLLILFAFSLANNRARLEQALILPLPLLSGSFNFDSVSQNLDQITSSSIVMSENDNNTIVLINATIPEPNYTAALLNYQNVLQGTFANSTHANIFINCTNISGGADIKINEDYEYNNAFGPSGNMEFQPKTWNGAPRYSVNVTIAQIRASAGAITFNSSGDMAVAFTYNDLNGTVAQNGTLNSNQASTMTINYANGGTLSVTFGSINGSSGSLEIQTQNLNITTSYSVVLPKINSGKNFGRSYNCMMNYTQGEIQIVRRV